jgi:hypothetical protein
MAVINVLHLPRDDRLRSTVKTIIDFVGEVYKDEILSDLKFVSFDPNDGHDVESAKHVAVREGLSEEVERRKKHKVEPTEVFFVPHYNNVRKTVWIPISKDWDAPHMLFSIAHEVTHHTTLKIPDQDSHALAEIFVEETGTLGLIERYWTAPVTLIKDLSMDVVAIFLEVATEYITRNYFLGLHREPIMTIPQANMWELSRRAHLFMLLFRRRRLVQEAVIIDRLFQNLAYADLPKFRRELHKSFIKLVKKLPVDVLESNRTKYEMLYRR